MNEQERIKLEYAIADIIIEKPHDFKIGRKQYRLYPVTLAKQHLLKRYIDVLSINQENLSKEPFLEVIRVVKEHKRECCEILAIHTAPNTYKDLYNNQAIAERRNVFLNVADSDIAGILVQIMKGDGVDFIVEKTGIIEENKRLGEIIKVKEKTGKNSLSFGGKTSFGSFIGRLKELGFSTNEILYERGYSFLCLVLSDKITSVYLTDDELQEVPEEAGGKLIDANDPQAMEKLKKALPGLKLN